MNIFSGHIPVEVEAYLPSLTILNISRNALEENIPSSIGDMNSLKILDLSYNHLNLYSLQLDGNYFSGKIPDSLSNTSLYGLYLSDNKLSGKIPSWLGNMTTLVELAMPNNHLEGLIPPEFCHLNHLEVLNLAGNSLSSIPSCFSPLSLKQVHLSRNMLQGELQDAFRNSSFLVTLDLGYNRINGSIPNWIFRLFNLTYLILNNNNLQGSVPIQLCQLDQLRLVNLSHNDLFGHIPPCLMTALRDKDYVIPDSNSTDIEEENDFMDMDIFYISFTVSYIIVLLAIAAVLPYAQVPSSVKYMLPDYGDEKPSLKPKKWSNEIDEIFTGKKRKKPEGIQSHKSNKDDAVELRWVVALFWLE
ncbi:hypothetical protein JRO89_XS01G0039800 [Xanthoceras sorbifolium]|uniref:Uncharacterized protein n=1 Tax=Xanthoceras sorbifolium TaxID=99658 RepID=A0ABQ8II69_9ROSI|nr:hypothetical protein JRO89_XS01G0039800 [Xanthoceras sorbifolium]